MKLFRLAYLFYPLPLVFFILNGSANLSGPRIGQTLGTLFTLFLVIGYLHNRSNASKGWLKRLLDVLSTILVSICAIAGKEISLEFSFLVFLWPLMAYTLPNQYWLKLLTKLQQAIILFCLIYFGINQYDFSNLFNSKVMWLFITFTLQYFFIAVQFNRSHEKSLFKDIGLSYIAVVISLGFYSSIVYSPAYLLQVAMMSAPSFYILFRLLKTDGGERQYKFVNWFRFLSIAGLTLFNLYLFLDTTQVLQAVMGGY